MPLEYAIDLGCPIKQRIGGDRALMSQRRLRRAVEEAIAGATERGVTGADIENEVLRWYFRSDPRPADREAAEARAKSDPANAVGAKPGAGRWLFGPISVAREHLIDLGEMATEHCLGCLANGAVREKSGKRPHPDSENPRGFGCLSSLRFPISDAAEQYVRHLLDDALKLAHAGQHDLRTLLIETLRVSEIDGRSAAALRISSAGSKVFARRQGFSVSRGFFRRTKMSTNQIFEVGFLVPRLSEGMCLFLSAFSGGIRVRDLPDFDAATFAPPKDRPWMLNQPTQPTPRNVLWTFELPPAPPALAADPGVADLRAFFTACFHAYSLGRGLILDAVIEPSDARDTSPAPSDAASPAPTDRGDSGE